MTKKNLKALAPKEPYGITRVDCASSRCYGWRVSLRRKGQMFVKTFHDKKSGGSAQALKLAEAHRDYIVSTHAPMTRRKFAEIIRRSNRTGISGVYKYVKRFTRADGSVGENWYWEANWPTTPGDSCRIAFSTKTYGEENARQMAIRARQKGLDEVEGFFWKSGTPNSVIQKFRDELAREVTQA